jgi:hypothetical protein
MRSSVPKNGRKAPEGLHNPMTELRKATQPNTHVLVGPFAVS